MSLLVWMLTWIYDLNTWFELAELMVEISSFLIIKLEYLVNIVPKVIF